MVNYAGQVVARRTSRRQFGKLRNGEIMPIDRANLIAVVLGFAIAAGIVLLMKHWGLF